jgi:glyceraldehyde-3-phosphate dehydrogenase/erythrose-4-phosphate dehydrogenase
LVNFEFSKKKAKMSRPAVGIGGAGRIGRLTLRCAVIADTVRSVSSSEHVTEK